MERLNEKRQALRIEERLPIKIIEGASGMVVETKNISASGVYFTTDKPMPIMSKVMITMLIPDAHGKNSKVECAGTVVRTAPANERDKTLYETAIFFDDITEKAKNTILKHIKKIITQK